MPNLVWTSGATVVTFAKGIKAGATHNPINRRVISEQLAGGEILSYELSCLSNAEVIQYELPHVSQTIRDAAFSFKDVTVKDSLLTFTLEDFSKSPTYTKTVRLIELTQIDEFHGDPAAPGYTLLARLQIEPA